MPMIARRLVVRGRVQGVGYRYRDAEAALDARRHRLGAQSPRRHGRGLVQGDDATRRAIRRMVPARAAGARVTAVDGSTRSPSIPAASCAARSTAAPRPA